MIWKTQQKPASKMVMKTIRVDADTWLNSRLKVLATGTGINAWIRDALEALVEDRIIIMDKEDEDEGTDAAAATDQLRPA